jgi:hypothetical protein
MADFFSVLLLFVLLIISCYFFYIGIQGLRKKSIDLTFLRHIHVEKNADNLLYSGESARIPSVYCSILGSVAAVLFGSVFLRVLGVLSLQSFLAALVLVLISISVLVYRQILIFRRRNQSLLVWVGIVFLIFLGINIILLLLGDYVHPAKTFFLSLILFIVALIFIYKIRRGKSLIALVALSIIFIILTPIIFENLKPVELAFIVDLVLFLVELVLFSLLVASVEEDAPSEDTEDD